MADNTMLFDPNEELDAKVTPTPLSDPVLTAIFQNVEVSGLAMRSLINATLEDSGDKPISEVVTLTPQSIHSETSARGFRIDVEVKTEDGEIVLVEVQNKYFASTNERALLYAEQSLASGAKRGSTLSEVTAAMPRVVVVNILEKAIRAIGGFHQVVELIYRETPYERATDKLEIHNLELDKYRKSEAADLNKPLQCWLTALCRAQDREISLREVVKMEAQLQAYYDHDPGFAQFVDRYGTVAALPEVRKAYRRWEYDVMLDKLEEERKVAKQKAQIAEGEARGEKAKAYTIARNLLAMNMPLDQIVTATGLTVDEVKTL
jgi:predicted transposase/invertase (TIGR01784 family)